MYIFFLQRMQRKQIITFIHYIINIIVYNNILYKKTMSDRNLYSSSDFPMAYSFHYYMASKCKN